MSWLAYAASIIGYLAIAVGAFLSIAQQEPHRPLWSVVLWSLVWPVLVLILLGVRLTLARKPRWPF